MEFPDASYESTELTKTKSTQKQRYENLDGIRGITAVTVVLFHFFSAYFPFLISKETANPWWGSDTPIAILYNGKFAVSVFFVLSGFVVSNAVAKTSRSLLSNVLSRVLRIGIPVLAAALFGWSLQMLFPNGIMELKATAPGPWLADLHSGAMPGILSALGSTLVGAFVTENAPFNIPLWSMKLEFIGSLGIYVFYVVAPGKYRIPLLVLVALGGIVLLRRPDYSAFALGAIIREFKANEKLPSKFAWVLFVLAIVFGAMMQDYNVRRGIQGLPGLLMPGRPGGVLAIFAAVALLYAVLGLPLLSSWLSTRPARYLGRISFGVYLVHFPLLYTMFVQPALALRETIPGAVLLCIVFVGSAIALGDAFTRLVDKPTLMLIQKLRDYRGTRDGVAVHTEAR